MLIIQHRPENMAGGWMTLQHECLNIFCTFIIYLVQFSNYLKWLNNHQHMHVSL